MTCLTMCPCTLFSFLSVAQRIQNNEAQLTWWKVRLLPGLAAPQWGGFVKPQPVFTKRPTDQRTKRLQETACNNITTKIPVFQRQKPRADVTTVAHPSTIMMQKAETQLSGTLPTLFNFIARMHTARWCTAIVPAQLLQTVSSGKSFLPKTNESHLLNSLTPVCCWLH